MLFLSWVLGVQWVDRGKIWRDACLGLRRAETRATRKYGKREKGKKRKNKFQDTLGVAFANCLINIKLIISWVRGCLGRSFHSTSRLARVSPPLFPLSLRSYFFVDKIFPFCFSSSLFPQLRACFPPQFLFMFFHDTRRIFYHRRVSFIQPVPRTRPRVSLDAFVYRERKHQSPMHVSHRFIDQTRKFLLITFIGERMKV